MDALTQSIAGRNALILIAVVVAAAALYWLRGILAPLALAIFLLILVDGLARWVRRLSPPALDRFSLPVALVLILLAFFGSIAVVIDGFNNFFSQLSGINARLDVLIAEAAAMMKMQVAPTTEQLLARIDPQAVAAPLVTAVQNIAADSFFVLVYLGFLIASRRGFHKKIVALFPTRGDRREAQHIFDRVRSGVESYVWVQTVTGAMIALGALAVMLLVGLDNALFWAFVIFLLSYIPIIGGAIAGLGPPLFALAQFSTYWQALVLFGVIQVILQVVGNIILPRMQARDQNIDAVVVLLSLAFWGALWGLTGAFLSTPLTVICMAILAEFPGSRWAAILLSGDGDPYPDER